MFSSWLLSAIAAQFQLLKIPLLRVPALGMTPQKRTQRKSLTDIYNVLQRLRFGFGLSNLDFFDGFQHFFLMRMRLQIR